MELLFCAPASIGSNVSRLYVLERVLNPVLRPVPVAHGESSSLLADLSDVLHPQGVRRVE